MSGAPRAARVFFWWGMSALAVLVVGLGLTLSDFSRGLVHFPGELDRADDFVLAVGVGLLMALPLVRSLALLRRGGRVALLAGFSVVLLSAVYLSIFIAGRTG